MQLFRNILVGVHLSRERELNPVIQQAIRSALWLARASSSSVTFFSVLPSEAARDEANDVLSALVRQAEESGLDAHALAAVGSPVPEIIRQVQSGHHDLVMIGVPVAKGLEYSLFGSTATQLMQKCPCPVWLAAAGSDSVPRAVLVASNLTSSANAVKLGVALARVSKSMAHVLNVVDYPLDHHWTTGDCDQTTVRYHEQVRETAEKALRAQLEQLAIPDGDDLQVHVVGRTGIPDVEILHFIREHSIDLAIVGRHSRGGFGSALFGQTAERLLPDLPCSLLVVQPAIQAPIPQPVSEEGRAQAVAQE